jgi:hypothetical protein
MHEVVELESEEAAWAGMLRPGSRKPLDDGGGLCGVHWPSLSTDGHGSQIEDPGCTCTCLEKRRETLVVALDIPSVGAKGAIGGKIWGVMVHATWLLGEAAHRGFCVMPEDSEQGSDEGLEDVDESEERRVLSGRS